MNPKTTIVSFSTPDGGQSSISLPPWLVDKLTDAYCGDRRLAMRHIRDAARYLEPTPSRSSAVVKNIVEFLVARARIDGEVAAATGATV